MKKLNKFAIIAVLGVMLFSINLMAATKAPPVASAKQSTPQVILGGETDIMTECVIFAGRHIFVGFVHIWSDQDYVYVRYSTVGNWYLTETHLHLATDWRNIPQTKTGNPIPGHFAYQMEHAFVNEYTYQIPRVEWKYGAAHCVVVDKGNGQEETGWARNKVPPYGEFPGRNWAWYFEMRN